MSPAGAALPADIMNTKTPLLAAAFLFSLTGGVFGDEFGDITRSLREKITEQRAGAGKAGSISGIEASPVSGKSSGTAGPQNDLKEAVLKHLDETISYCDKNIDDCNGADDRLRNFASGIGGGRCNNRGFNCVNEVLEMCRGQAAEEKINPMYYMACAAMLGKMGERDCAEGRGACSGRLQGTLYFSLRAAAGCHKSYEKDAAKQAEADKLIKRFSSTVRQNVKGVYVADVEEGESIVPHLAWRTGRGAGIMGAKKILELAFERLAWEDAGAALSATGALLPVFSTAMLLHDVAALEMNNQVCLEWDHDYEGSYANVAGSLIKITGHIK